MVRKLQFNEYLNRYDNMDAGERTVYERRVGEWLKSAAPVLMARTTEFNAGLQNVMQVSGGWNDQECQAFEEGVKLLSAQVHTGGTWLPDMIYTKSAKRVINKIVAVLRDSTESKEDAAGGKAAIEREQNGAGSGSAEREQTGPEVNRAATQVDRAATPFQAGAGDGNIAGGDKQREGVSPARPKHIDQYVHLLPQKTQERAAQIKDLYRELDEAREKMRLLMDDETASPADREAWAKRATAIDNRIRKTLDELDSEWDKLVKEGRVVVDDLGNARVVDNNREPIANNQEDVAELTSEDKAKRRELRKWLVDTRRGNGDTREEHVRKWQENFREFLKFEGDAAFEDEKIKAAAEHYGIELEKVKK